MMKKKNVKTTIYECLENIRKEHGGVLRPVDVAEAARSVSHPLHDQFTWNNKQVGDVYRIWEARMLIRGARPDKARRGRRGGS